MSAQMTPVASFQTFVLAQLADGGGGAPPRWRMRGCARALASVVVALFGIDRFSDLTDPVNLTSGSAGLPAGTDRIFRQTVHPQPASVGTESTMVLKKWNKIYVKTTADKSIVMLPVEKLITTEAKDTRWTAVDPALNIQVINIKNSTTYSTKTQTNVTYSPIPGFTKDEKSAIEKASWEFVRKALAGRDVEPMKRRVHVGKPRLRALIPLLESLGVVASLFGSGPGLGLVSVRAGLRRLADHPTHASRPHPLRPDLRRYGRHQQARRDRGEDREPHGRP